MVVAWMVDGELETELWRPIRELALGAARKGGGGLILDIGGGGGGFSYYISKHVPGYQCVSVDIAPSAPSPGVECVLGDALRLPFADGSFDLLVARAVLHHFPDRLPEAMGEAHRVLKPGGRFVIEEPCSGNPIAAMARHAAPTDRHDPGERPMSSAFMLESVSQRFTVLEARHFFLVSYLAPHLVARLPKYAKPAARALSLAAARVDERLLSRGGYCARFSAYIHILTIKGK